MWRKTLSISITILALSGCAGMDIKSARPIAPGSGAEWAVLPFANNTETPMANERAAAMGASILQTDSQRVTGTLPISSRTWAILGGDWKKEYTTALSAARRDGVRYALAGSVDEWTYRAGINAEPVVTMTLWVVDVPTGETIWTGLGSAHGGTLGRSGTGGIAQGLMQRLIHRALKQ